MNLLLKYFLNIIILTTINSCFVYANDLPKLKISENKRFLIKEDNTPFVWIGDTFWDWYKITPTELDEYLSKRASQGYTIIQMQIGAYGRANYAGNWCFGGINHKDITQPQEAFWQHADLWMEKIKEHGLYAAVGLSWIINHWNRSESAKYSVTDYYNYGKFVGNRYKDYNNIVWISLNESTYQNAPVDKINAVCNGIRDGDTGCKLLTLHPLAGTNTSEEFGDIVDFNSWQTARFLAPAVLPYKYGYAEIEEIIGNYNVWEAIASDYAIEPTKPVIDMEAWYEGHLDDMPVNSTGTLATAWHVRRRAYFTIFAGGFGHTYGAAGLAYNINVEEASWQQALSLPGGEDMGHIAELLDSDKRPFLKLAPAQDIIVSGQSNSYDSHKQAARADDGSYAYVYSADGSSFSIDLTMLGQGDDKIQAQWFNPREGEFQVITDEYERVGNQLFSPPGVPSSNNDYVLVLKVKFTSATLIIKENADDFICYPNPVNTSLNIKNLTDPKENITFGLYNLLGEKLYSSNSLNNKQQYIIDMSSYMPGMYILEIATSELEKDIKKKIIKR